MLSEKEIAKLEERISMLEDRVKILESSLVLVGKIMTAKTTTKYIELTRYLRKDKKPKVTLSFKEIEDIVGFKLPKSAYEHQPFWANSSSHTISYSWMQVGYMVRNLDLKNQKVTFVLVKE